MTLKETDLFSYSNALTAISDKLLEQQKVASLPLDSFWEFTRDIWSQGYEHPEYFRAWHVEFVCREAQEKIEDGLHYVCVMPRVHFKSTILGHAFSVWHMLKSSTDVDILYLSYSDSLSTEHTTEMKKYIRNNPTLSEIFIDLSPTAISSFRYKIGSRIVTIKNGGIFSFKRGLHTKGMIADDILKDPANPLDPSQVEKVEEHFYKESMFIPVKGSPIVVMGTPMLPNDLFTKLKSNSDFFVRVLPALDPVPGRRVLFPELYPEDWLLKNKQNRPSAFASEMMLQPFHTTDAFIRDEEIEAVENADLVSLDPYIAHNLDSDFTVAGFDIGKHRHPSHLSVYISKNGKLFQIHQSFLDNWSYASQIKYLEQAAKNFKIDAGYIDNTDRVFEERGLPSCWKFMIFSVKSKHEMASIFERYIEEKRIAMLRNERQRSQIVSVNNNLQSPETLLGHGESFWSNAQALFAYNEIMSSGLETKLIGNITDVFSPVLSTGIISTMPQLQKQTIFEKEKLVACPQCGETASWIEEKQLCLLCYTQKAEDWWETKKL